MSCKKCNGTDFYKDGRCKLCARLYTQNYKRANRWVIKLQKGRANKRKLLKNPKLLATKIMDLRREADWLESLLKEAGYCLK